MEREFNEVAARNHLKGELERNERLINAKHIYMWGVGSTRNINQVSFQRNKFIPEVYIDNNPRLAGSTYPGDGVRIISSEMAFKELTFEDAVIIVCSFNPDTTRRILEEINEHHIDCGIGIDTYFYSKNREKVLECFNLLEDNESKSLFAEVVDARIHYRIIADEFVSRNQYFAVRGFGIPNPQETFVDFGAYVGDSAEQFIKESTGVFGKIYAFEPEKSNFHALEVRTERLIAEWNLKSHAIENVNAGIGLKSGHLSFIDEGPDGRKVGARFDESAGEYEQLPVFSVDDFFKDKGITFIKADIESYEYDMLQGGAAVISSRKPKLAICIYHAVTDLFEILLLIHSICPEYKFKMKHHSETYEETVLYAYV